MQEQDKKQFAVMMGVLGAAFRCDVGKETMAAYFRFLSDLSLDAVRYGVEATIKNCDRFPVVAKLREFSNAYRIPEKRKPVQTENLLEEFSQEEIERCKNMTPEDFSKMLDELSQSKNQLTVV